MKSQEYIWNELYKNRLSWKKETANLPNILKEKSILELGFGNGKTLQAIARQNPKSITAVDFSQDALDKAKELVKSDKIDFIKADITSLNLDKEFDFIICYYTLNNLLESERKEAVSQMHKSLKKGGFVLFEDFAVGDFREKEGVKRIESHTIRRKDGLICHFFLESELKSLFSQFSKITLSKKVFSPFRSNKEKKRIILSVIIKK